MGKGDRGTTKGKRASGSYGNTRPHSVRANVQSGTVSKAAPKPVTKAASKAVAKTATKAVSKAAAKAVTKAAAKAPAAKKAAAKKED